MSGDPSEATRRLIAVVLLVLYAAISIVAIREPSAGAIFDKLHPIVLLVLGYYFGRAAERRRK